MKWVSTLITDARGSLGDTTWARNPYGVYSRPRRNPIQPRTLSQQTNRANFTFVTQQWALCTPAQIVGWNALAATQLWVDSLGHKFAPSGFALFTQLNLNLLNTGQFPIYEPAQNLGDYGAPGPLNFVLNSTAGVLDTMNVGLSFAGSTYPSNVILRMTAPFSANATFVAKQQFRTLAQGWQLGNSGSATLLQTPITIDSGAVPSGATIVPTSQMIAGLMQSITFHLGNVLTTPSTAKFYMSGDTPPDMNFFYVCDLPLFTGVFDFTLYAGRDFPAFASLDTFYFGIWLPAGVTLQAQFGAGGAHPRETYYVNGQPTGSTQTFTLINDQAGIDVYVQEGGPYLIVNPLAEYGACFRIPLLGEKVGVEMRLIDQQSGQSSAVSKAVATVTGT